MRNITTPVQPTKELHTRLVIIRAGNGGFLIYDKSDDAWTGELEGAFSPNDFDGVVGLLKKYLVKDHE